MSKGAEIDLVMGGGSFGYFIAGPEDVKKSLGILKSGGVNLIDTAQAYGESEALLGQVEAGKLGFQISTKDSAAIQGRYNAASMEENAVQSLARLRVPEIDIFFLHMPDLKTPLSEYIPTLDRLHKKGVFRRFGISNFSPGHVEQLHAYCKENNFVLPTVYQGNYNILSRRQEHTLFPVLRKLGISFQAYSTLAGGFLTKSKEDIAAGAGRFNKDFPFGAIYMAMYARPLLLDSLGDWENIAKEEGCSKALLAYRWVRYHSILKPEYGDTMIIGGASISQLQDTLDGIRQGPLSKKTVDRLQKLWETVEPDAPLDAFEDFIRDNMAPK